jgi:HEPN domain-containing protein
MTASFDWIYKSQFNVWSNNSAYWHSKAVNLMQASEILWKSYKNDELIDSGDTHRLLMGLSFELIFKAFYVAKGESPPITHSLNNLTGHCDLQLSKKDRKILEVLSGYILWEGRYPTPNKPNEKRNLPFYHGIKEQNDPFVNTLPIEKQLDGKSNSTLKRSDLDFEHLIGLWRKLNDEYVNKYIQDA